MPHSWLRISSQTSRKLERCKGGKKVDFEACATQIIEAEQGVKVLQFWFEQNGKYAHVLIEWDDPEQKLNVVFDTQAIEVVDLVKSEDIDRIATARNDGE
jgi:hypothetical protein